MPGSNQPPRPEPLGAFPENEDTEDRFVPSAGVLSIEGRAGDVSTLRRVARIFGPYRGQIGLLLVAIVATTVFGLVDPFVIRLIVDDAIGKRDAGLLVVLVAIMVAAPLVSGAIGVGVVYLSNRIGQAAMRDIRSNLYAHLQRLSLRFFTETRTGEIQSRLSNDVGGVRDFVTYTAPGMVFNVVAAGATLAAMIVISPLLTLVALAAAPIFLWATVRAGRVRRTTSDQTQRSLAALMSLTQETLSVGGILLSKLYGQLRHAQAQFDAENERLTELEVRQQMVGRWLFMLIDAVFAVTPAFVYLVGGLRIIGAPAGGANADITLGSMIAFTALLAAFFYPLADVLHVNVELQGALALFDRIFEYLDLPVEIQDPPDAIRLRPRQVRGWLAFDHVSFAYRGEATRWSSLAASEPPGLGTLHDVSFDIRPGELAALVGPSGAGKTTVTYLVTRLYDAASGKIAIDGHDVRRIALDSLSELIGVVTQETYLFHASVSDNLRYARLDATDREIVEAATAAAIHDRIMEFPDGYDTVVGERGYRLSGGERQRLSIARVILKDPRFLIMDEATSALDTHSERLIQAALARLMEGRTTLAIAHRLSTVLAADVILVMDRGRIVERGRHAELLRLGGLYARLYEEQFSPLHEIGVRAAQREPRPGQPDDGEPGEHAHVGDPDRDAVAPRRPLVAAQVGHDLTEARRLALRTRAMAQAGCLTLLRLLVIVAFIQRNKETIRCPSGSTRPRK